MSDALLQLGYRNGGFLSGPTMWSPARQAGDTKIIGPAYTVQYVPLDDEVSPKAPYHYVGSWHFAFFFFERGRAILTDGFIED